jgi:phosphatidate cytidylyltransferase
VRAWWLLSATLIIAFILGRGAMIILFGLLSFRALRDFITVTPTRRADHRTLFWVFVVFTPLQFVLVWYAPYEFYSVVILLYSFLFILIRVALEDDYKRFLERTAKIQCGWMICVYCLSYAPAVLNLSYVPEMQPANGEATGEAPFTAEIAIRSSENEEFERGNQNTRLLLFLVVVAQASDALQYLFNKWVGRHLIAPEINSNKTWEGFAAGCGATAIVGSLLSWAVLFNVWQSAAMALLVAIGSAAGSLSMSAIKRDRGIRDYGIAVEGHGGLLDRIDSLCFAAPLFFHVTKYCFTGGG